MKLSDEIINSLSINLRKKINNIKNQSINIEEIRLRVNKPLIINGDSQDYFYNDINGDLDLVMRNPYIVTKEDIEDTFQIICKYSVHSFMDDIKKGFITLRGGHRIGIVGKVIIENGQVKNIKHISSLNIRVSREIKGCSKKVLPHIIKNKNQINNTIIISPPQCGKTTILRDIVRNISNGNREYGFSGVKVALIDERNEIAGSCMGIAQLDVGMRTDVMETCPKDLGIMMVLRSMSPNVIVTDEIGNEKEIKALYTALNGGVSLITTVHGDSIEDILHRTELKRLLDGDLFRKVIILSSRNGPGTIEKFMIYRKRDGTLEIKIILVGMLIGCSYLVGEDISKRYIKRHKQLNDLIRVLEIIRMDLAFGMYTLEEIFRNISLKDEYDFNEFFSKFADELSKEDGKTIDNILNETIHILYKDTYLKENEIEEFKKLILSLGKSEVESQERLIDLTVENLKKLTVESKEDIKNKGNLYKKLITFSGICIGIILI